MKDTGLLVDEGQAQRRTLWRAFGWMLLAISGVTVLVFVPVLWHTWQARDWREGQCTVLYSQVKQHAPVRRGSRPSYSMDMAYTLVVGGSRYQGYRYRFAAGADVDPSELQALVADLPSGARVPCYYNPDDPGQSVLDRRLTLEGGWLLVPPLSLVLGLACLLMGYKSPGGRQHKRPG